MNLIKKIGVFALGVGATFVAQWIFGTLTVALKIPDPALAIFYSSIGVLASVVLAVYFSWKKNWLVVLGLIIGIPLWWFFVLTWMTVTGSWL